MGSAAPPPSDLPQEQETWEGDVLNVGDKERPLWLAWVTCLDWDLILAHSIFEVEPGPDRLWDTLVHAMREPLSNEPHRPTRLRVRREGRWAALKPRLKKLGIRLVMADQFESVDGVPELIDEVYQLWAQKYEGNEELP
jgi:hypothetical protein